MGQTRILSVIGEFLRQTNPEETKRIRLEDFQSGHCFGFALVMAAMAAISLSDWWVAGLLALEKWDGDANKLDNLLSLPQAVKPITLGQFIVRALNYIVPNHLVHARDFKLLEDNQATILRQTTGHFEIIDYKNRVYKIKNRNRIGGNFNYAQLNILFSEKLFDKSICLVSNCEHTITVLYKDAIWYVYDPNYPHDTPSHILKACDSKQEMIEEITSILGFALGIEMAWLDETSKLQSAVAIKQEETPWDKFIDKLTFDDAIQLIADDGFACICRNSPNVLPKLYSLLQEVSPRAKQSQGADAIFSALMHVARDGWSGLLLLLTSCPEYFQDYQYILRQYPQAAHKLLKIFLIKNNFHYTNFSLLVKHAPDHVNPLALLTLTIPQAPDYFVSCLAEKSSKGKSGLAYLLIYNPANLYFLLYHAKESTRFPAVLAEILCDRYKKSGESWFHFLVKRAPGCLNLVLTILFQYKQVETKAIELFLAMNKEGESVLSIVKQSAVTYFPQVLQLLANTKLIDSRQFISIAQILEYAQEGNEQLSLLKALLKHSNKVTLDLLDALPNNLGKKRDLAAMVIHRAIHNTKTLHDLFTWINSINTNRKFYFLKKRLHCNSIFGANCSGVETFSPVWWDILNHARKRFSEIELTKSGAFDRRESDASRHLKEIFQQYFPTPVALARLNP